MLIFKVQNKLIIDKMQNKQKLLGMQFIILGMFFFITISCIKENPDKIGQENYPILTTTEVTQINFTTAVSGGNITDDKGTTVTTRGVCWSVNENPTINDNKTIDGSGAGNFTSLINGLEPNTTYYVRAFATNNAGSGYGSAMSFTTNDDGSGGSYTDPRDGNIYRTVIIGDQIWMTENLRYLPSVNRLATGSRRTPYFYVYNYDDTSVDEVKAYPNYSLYGVLYNWPAACESCPPGWHLPSDAEWTQLADYLGGINVAGGKLKATTLWNSPNTGATNETGYMALPGGKRSIGVFFGIGNLGQWWCLSEYSENNALNQSMHYNYNVLSNGNADKEMGFSVRCIKD